MTTDRTKAAARVIRERFKARGWSARQVSVTIERYSMGSTIRVRLRDGSIPFRAATEIAKAEEEVRRDEATGEILNGGNLYVECVMDEQAKRVKIDRVLDAVDFAVDSLPNLPPGCMAPIDLPAGCPTGLYLAKGRFENVIAVWGESYISEAISMDGVCLIVALELERGEQ